MCYEPNFTLLLNHHYTTLILRLTLDAHGQLQRGVVVDMNENPVGQFRQLDELLELIRHWLETQPTTQPPTTAKKTH